MSPLFTLYVFLVWINEANPVARICTVSSLELVVMDIGAKLGLQSIVLSIFSS